MVIMSESISMLNEYCQCKNILPIYNIVSTNGPPHNPIFTCNLEVENNQFTTTGSNKKMAKSKCAEIAVKELKVLNYLENNKKKFKYEISDIEKVAQSIWNDGEVLVFLTKYNDYEKHVKTVHIKMVE